jgi:Family of unknown function (DUF6445)
VVVLDNVFAAPEAIVATVAARARFAPAPGTGGYPGIQAPAPADYARALLAAAAPALALLFGNEDGAIGGIGCTFSLVTDEPATLHPLQTVPHVDIAEPDRFAVLHYLCDAPFGGTAFYRQDATGLEQVGRRDWHRCQAARDAGLATMVPSGYPSPATPGYTRTAAVPAKMDRMLVYRSHSLHSGIIVPDLAHPADPHTGRLTGNLFAIYRAA